MLNIQNCELKKISKYQTNLLIQTDEFFFKLSDFCVLYISNNNETNTKGFSYFSHKTYRLSVEGASFVQVEVKIINFDNKNDPIYGFEKYIFKQYAHSSTE